ncbi:cation diffusion facilitator family transporter [Rhizobium sp. PL01]|uniref:cation diffusion facilitator family transporter n=1 Tax=Rhizobium sp. PL01 TaxID=3085631 RepID=UPI003993DAC1
MSHPHDEKGGYSHLGGDRSRAGSADARSEHDQRHEGHDHAHAPTNFGKAFAIGIILNTVFVAIEAGYGLYANSMALLADAGHNLSDVLGLIVAWIAVALAKRKPTGKYTYGLGASSILAALANAMLLLVAVGAIAWEAVGRFWDPAPVTGGTVMIVAGIGILINGVTAYLFSSGSKGDLNIRGAYLHMAADAAVSGGVVAAGLFILQTGWAWIDPAVSLVIVVVILWSTWGLLKGSVAMSLNAVPDGIDAAGVRDYLVGLPGVSDLHDLHIWPMSTSETALTAHLVVPAGTSGDQFLVDARTTLLERYRIHHATLQVEAGNMDCSLAPTNVV